MFTANLLVSGKTSPNESVIMKGAEIPTRGKLSSTKVSALVGVLFIVSFILLGSFWNSQFLHQSDSAENEHLHSPLTSEKTTDQSPAFQGALGTTLPRSNLEQDVVTEPVPFSALAPAHFEKFKEAREFADRISDLEQSLLAEHPLLTTALEREQNLQQQRKGIAAALNRDSTLSASDKFRRSLSLNMLKLESFKELLTDPEYAPFIRDGLEHGRLASEIPKIYAWQWSNFGGINQDNLTLPASDHKNIETFGTDFAEMADSIRVELDKAGLAPQDHLKADKQLSDYAAFATEMFVLRYYKQSLLPQGWAEEHQRHYRSIMQIKNLYGSNIPVEISRLIEDLDSSKIGKLEPVIQTF